MLLFLLIFFLNFFFLLITCVFILCINSQLTIVQFLSKFSIIIFQSNLSFINFYQFQNICPIFRIHQLEFILFAHGLIDFLFQFLQFLNIFSMINSFNFFYKIISQLIFSNLISITTLFSSFLQYFFTQYFHRLPKSSETNLLLTNISFLNLTFAYNFLKILILYRFQKFIGLSHQIFKPFFMSNFSSVHIINFYQSIQWSFLSKIHSHQGSNFNQFFVKFSFLFNPLLKLLVIFFFLSSLFFFLQFFSLLFSIYSLLFNVLNLFLNLLIFTQIIILRLLLLIIFIIIIPFSFPNKFFSQISISKGIFFVCISQFLFNYFVCNFIISRQIISLSSLFIQFDSIIFIFFIFFISASFPFSASRPRSFTFFIFFTF
ncbi:hypothetical protein PPERSA_12466 [Pseudocohnilembus persalinus]|uniref:Transmembrane protein n=1 Tax=Pseudocohnilembus persalinus TaxID=266149 RepID=A0A0V0QNS8_PSEPJ|nr:hypothetical protein PPERSA_12466 [Pseudocohnilembus persalinus]|eukprot:KRX04019.1 hypothetical protein PPERSA_12466 [Pseudocohnilembus persalinus]